MHIHFLFAGLLSFLYGIIAVFFSSNITPALPTAAEKQPIVTDNSYQSGELFLAVKAGTEVCFDKCNHTLFIGHYSLSEISAEYGITFANHAFPLLKDRPRLANNYLLRFSKPQLAAQLIRKLEALPNVLYAERVPVYASYYMPNDLNPEQWSLTQIQAPEAWDIETGSTDITLAIVDDAVLTTHEDLQANIIAGFDVADNDNNPSPPAGATTNCFSHGTHCAGIAAAVTDNGIGIASLAGHVKIMPVKCKPDSDLGTNCNSLPATFAGIEYAIANNADVISMSFGGYAFSQTMQLLFDEAYTNNIVCVAAAGNDNSSNESYPASYNHVISVAASNQNDAKAGFSNYGTAVDVTAPGTNILSTVAGTNGSYAQMQGTSMATPLVASLCALMLSHVPTLTVDELETCLKDNCDNIDAQNPSFIGLLGAGRINAFKAISCLQTTLLANFSFTPQQACPTQSVQFTDLSVGENITTWAWTFEGGTPATSNVPNPTVSFASVGTHNITLTVSNANGTNSLTRTISIVAPTAVLAGNATIIEGFSTTLSVAFTGTPPFSFTYTENGANPQTIADIAFSPYSLSVSPVQNTVYTITAANDNFCTANASGTGMVTVLDNTDTPISDNVNLPSWPIISTNGTVFDVQFYPTQNTATIPFSTNGVQSSTGVGFDECGLPLFYLLHSGSNVSGQLFVVSPNGTILNAGAGYNALRGNIETQVVPVPQTPNEWYVIYSAWTNEILAGGDASYTPTNIMYARFFYDGITFTNIVSDVILQANANTFVYSHGKAVSNTTTTTPNQHFLYACRKSFTTPTGSIDRFVINSTGIVWQDNTGDFPATTWVLTASGSPLELSPDGQRLAVVVRNQSSFESDLVLFDTDNFTTASMQIINIADLIIEPDGLNVLTPQTPENAAIANANVGYLTYLDQKVGGVEFSPNGDYLYFVGGGFFTSGMSNVTYVGQIDLTTSFPYRMRLQTQIPTVAGYTASSGVGCNLGATCMFRAIVDIESGFDGNLYFTKSNSDTLFVLPSPDMPMPQHILPYFVNLATPTAPNRILAGNNITVLPDGIDHKLYLDTLHRFFKLPVIITQCGECIPTAANPQTVSIETNTGEPVESFTLTQCPQYIEICLPTTGSYNLRYLDETINNVVENGVMGDQVPFTFQTGGLSANIMPIAPQCVQNEPIALNASPAGGIFSGDGVIDDTMFDPSVAGVGSHTITYNYVGNGGCTATATLNIEVQGVLLTTNATEIICTGQSVQLSATGGTNYTWSPTDYLDNPNIANPTATPPVTTVYTVQSTSPEGCISEAISVVVTSPLPFFPDEGIDTTICQFDTLTWQLTDVLPISNYTYVWSPSLNLSDPTIPNPVAIITEPTIYTLIITGSDGCQTTRNYTIRGNMPAPEIIPNPVVLCDDTPKKLSVNPPEYAQYLWNVGFVTDTIEISQTGIYTVTVTDENNCTATASTPVIDADNLTPNIVGNLELQNNTATVELTLDTDYAFYNWSTGDDESTITVTNPGQYTVTVTDINGCTGTDIAVVTRYDPYWTAIPNAFSPNDDGINDVFRVSLHQANTINMAIYNRWGQKIFEGNDNLAVWDGKFKGNNCDIGAYSYVVQIVFDDGEQRTLQGHVLLVR